MKLHCMLVDPKFMSRKCLKKSTLSPFILDIYYLSTSLWYKFLDGCSDKKYKLEISIMSRARYA